MMTEENKDYLEELITQYGVARLLAEVASLTYQAADAVGEDCVDYVAWVRSADLIAECADEVTKATF
jgi:hypothetical protein